jgi:HSP20 family molecular chaperone IbpA
MNAFDFAIAPKNSTQIIAEHAPIDLRSNADSYEIWVNVPGFKKESIEVKLHNKLLTITGKDPVLSSPSNLNIARRNAAKEFRYQVILNTPIDVPKTENKLDHGVLYLRLVKSLPDAGVNIPL